MTDEHRKAAAAAQLRTTAVNSAGQPSALTSDVFKTDLCHSRSQLLLCRSDKAIKIFLIAKINVTGVTDVVRHVAAKCNCKMSVGTAAAASTAVVHLLSNATDLTKLFNPRSREK